MKTSLSKRHLKMVLRFLKPMFQANIVRNGGTGDGQKFIFTEEMAWIKKLRHDNFIMIICVTRIVNGAESWTK